MSRSISSVVAATVSVAVAAAWVSISRSPGAGPAFLAGVAVPYALLLAAVAAVGWRLGRLPGVMLAVLAGAVFFSRPLPHSGEASTPPMTEKAPTRPSPAASSLIDSTWQRLPDSALDRAAKDYYEHGGATR